MNQPTHFITVHDEDRKKNFIKIFGGNRVPVKNFVPVMAHLPVVGKQPVYLLDLKHVTQEQKVKMADHISSLFSFSSADVLAEMKNEGVPILAKNCTFSSTDLGLFYSIVLDDHAIENNYKR